MFDGKSFQDEVDARTNLTGTNKFELLLFRVGRAPDSENAELFGINVFKVREIIAMPEITAIPGSLPHMLGVVNIRGTVLPVIDLPAVVGCSPRTGLNIMLVTEFAQTAQAFAVESVEDGGNENEPGGGQIMVRPVQGGDDTVKAGKKAAGGKEVGEDVDPAPQVFVMHRLFLLAVHFRYPRMLSPATVRSPTWTSRLASRGR